MRSHVVPLVIFLLIFGVSAEAQAQPAQVLESRVVEVEVPAPSLEGNLLGTPTTQGAAVYLPPGYDSNPSHRYPVVYLLHGIFDNYRVFTGHFEVPAIADRLIAAGKLPNTLIVMPNGGNQYGGGFYRNSSVSGNWGDYITGDLVSFVDKNFRTLAKRESRAIVGHSMGGFGALHLTMTRPEVFAVAWAMSPCCLTAIEDFGFGNSSWKRTASIKTAAEVDELLATRDFYPIAALGVATTFMPAPGKPPMYIDLPFEIVRGEVVIDTEKYDRYLDTLPLHRVRESREALRSLAGLGLGVGLSDQFRHIPAGTLEFARRLGEERIPHQLDVFDGDHRIRTSERLEHVILPWVGGLLEN